MIELFVWNLAVVGGATLALTCVLALLHRVESRVSSTLARRIGWRASLYPTAVVGVPLHELSHIAAARLFGHRVAGCSLFEPDPTTGTLGYVRYAYRRRSLWQLSGTFFVGIAPFVAGAAVLVLVGATMLPPGARVELLTRAHQLLRGGPTDLGHVATLAGYALASVQVSPWLALQLYVAVAVASHMAPSPRDLSGGLLGGVVLAVISAGAVTALAATSLTVLPFVVVLVPVALFAAVAVLLQTAYALVVLLLTRPARRRLLALPR